MVRTAIGRWSYTPKARERGPSAEGPQHSGQLRPMAAHRLPNQRPSRRTARSWSVRYWGR